MIHFKGTKRAILFFALGLGLASPLSAHHGFGTFDIARTIELKGTITRVEFVNPHAWVFFDVTGDDGEIQHWRCEMRAATVLRRSGWSEKLFVPGDPIELTASPDRRDPRSCYLSTVRFADGSTAERYGQLVKAEPVQAPEERQARLASGEPNISGDWAPEQYVMENANGLGGGLVPLSVAQGERELAADGERPWQTSKVNFTPAGQKAADDFDMRSPEQNPRMRCETTSILFDWDFDGPVNRITQNGDTITLQYGQYGFTRTIHMDQTGFPANMESSRAGYSIGRWENDALIVETRGFLPGVLAPPVMNSDRLYVKERFSLDAGTFTLTRQYEATDPVYYTDSYKGSDTLNIADIPYDPDPCTDYSRTNYQELQKE